MFTHARTLARVRESSVTSAMAKTHIAVRDPGREVVSLKRKFDLMASSASQPRKEAAGDEHRAAGPATAVTGACHRLTAVGKTAPPSMASKGASLRPACMSNWETSSRRLNTKHCFPSSPWNRKRSPNHPLTEGASSSPAGFRAIGELTASHHPIAKAGATSSAMSKASLHRMAIRRSPCHLQTSSLRKPTFAERYKRISEEPRRPSTTNKKAKYVPADPRERVQRRLGMFRELASKLQRDKEDRPDIRAFKLLKNEGIIPTRRDPGAVPGVQVGDEFSYRAELMVAGLHGSPVSGIDSTPYKGTRVATCVVSSKGYYINVMDMNNDVLVYSGEGGNPSFESTRKVPAGDQMLLRGNLALKNSMDTQTPVRVVHGFKVPRGGESLESKQRTAVKYVYDGLYHVEDFWWETGREGYRVLKFQLRRQPGQPKLDLKQVWRSRAARKRPGRCIDAVHTDGRGGRAEHNGGGSPSNSP